MSRMNLLLAAAVAAGVVGCAQCDTCDDFPVPCVGPNCGQGLMPGGIPGYLDATAGQAPAVMGVASPAPLATPPVDDSAGPGPAAPPAPPATPSPTTPPADSASPPAPMEPAPAPK